MKIAILTFDASIRMYQETLLFFKRYFEVEHSVSVLGCAGDLLRCTSLSALGIKINLDLPNSIRDATCKKCKVNQCELANNSEFKLNNELDKLNPEQEKIIVALAAKEICKSSELLDIYYSDCPIGKLAFYDFAMRNKIDDRVILHKKQIADYIYGLSDCFKVWNFINRFLITRKVDAVVYINGNYSLNAIAREVFLRHQIRCWSIEYTMFNTATQKRVYLEENRLDHSRTWPSFNRISKNYRCSKNDTKVALSGFKSRFRGIDHNSYSSPVRGETWIHFDEFKDRFESLVSIFVSSSDELRVHEIVYGFKQDNTFFKNQIEWLKFLIDKSDPNVGYVIRIHPRLKPNKRDKVEAVEYQEILKAIELARQLDNFYIIEGDDSISSYYILLNSMIAIVSWSTIALESSILGIPVVACFPKNMAYPIEKMSPQPNSLADIEALIKCKYLPKRNILHDVEVLRWVGINYYAIGIEILGARYRRRVLSLLRSFIDRLILISPKIFNTFFYKKYKKSIGITSSSGEIRLNFAFNNFDQELECVGMLDDFRKEIFQYFKISSMFLGSNFHKYYEILSTHISDLMK